MKKIKWLDTPETNVDRLPIHITHYNHIWKPTEGTSDLPDIRLKMQFHHFTLCHLFGCIYYICVCVCLWQSTFIFSLSSFTISFWSWFFLPFSNMFSFCLISIFIQTVHNSILYEYAIFVHREIVWNGFFLYT